MCQESEKKTDPERPPSACSSSLCSPSLTALKKPEKNPSLSHGFCSFLLSDPNPTSTFLEATCRPRAGATWSGVGRGRGERGSSLVTGSGASRCPGVCSRDRFLFRVLSLLSLTPPPKTCTKQGRHHHPSMSALPLCLSQLRLL